MPIHVISPGPLTTVQDLGRYGYSHLGISPGGAADRLSFRIGNLLAGNSENVPALEMTMLGATLEFEQAAIVVLTGAQCTCRLGTYAVPSNRPAEIPRGGVLKCGEIRSGVRAYLAIRGGFDVPLVMGSTSTHLGGHFGGFQGRRLQAGDVLNIRDVHRTSRPRTLKNGSLDGLFDGAIHITWSSQSTWFGPDAYEHLVSSPYTVSEHSDRAGVRLEGEPLLQQKKLELVTDGNPLGAIQVTKSGQPIIIFVDQQTTGGYPKIASVISADMHRIGQLAPRVQVRFASIEIHEAIDLLRRQEQWLQQVFL